MKSRCTLVGLLALIGTVAAQELVPRAYVITPINANAVIVTWSFYDGGIDLSGTIPITGATGRYTVPTFSYYHTFGLLGRSANITASLPYAVGTFSGTALGRGVSLYRSGLADFSARLSVNLIGGPAMPAEEFARWKQKTILGASVKLLAPTGQYDPRKLINWGINRWAIKPEIGYSHRWNAWMFDSYAGVWFYTENPQSFDLPLPQPQTEKPIGSLESHLIYYLQRFSSSRAWVSVDGHFWWGGITALNGISHPETKQTSSRLGVTLALPLTKRQSIKVAYSNGTYIRFGGNYQNVQVAWQYSWIGWPK